MAEKNKQMNISFKNYIKAALVAYIITAVVFIVSAILLTYGKANEDTIKILSFISTFISAVAAGYIMASGMEKRGILWGALGGLIYAAILMAIFYIFGKNTDFTSGKVLCLVFSLIGGALGGIFGINTKK